MKIIDVHGHVGPWPFPSRCRGLSDALGVMRRHGISRCILSSTLAIVYDMAEGNERLAEAIRGCEEALAYVVLNPNDLEGSCAELDKYQFNGAFVGVKIHCGYSRTPTDSPPVRRLLEEAGRRGMPALVHRAGAGATQALAAACGEIGGLSVILAHAGAETQDEMSAIRAAPNVYVEFCSSRPACDKIARALECLGPERLLFGSDLTLLDPALSLGMVSDAAMSADHRRMMLWDNAARLFRIE